MGGKGRRETEIESEYFFNRKQTIYSAALIQDFLSVECIYKSRGYYKNKQKKNKKKKEKAVFAKKAGRVESLGILESTEKGKQEEENGRIQEMTKPNQMIT